MPTGTGRGGKYRFSPAELRRLMGEGVGFLVGRGLAVASDLEHTEAGGRLDGAEPDAVSHRALERGYDQCGTLGSGNHFLEVQVVDSVHDEAAARAMGLAHDMVVVLIHSGSRGLGYQVCDDALKMLRGAPAKYGIELPDRQLVLRPDRQRRRSPVHRRDVCRGQFRLVQPATADVAGPGVLRDDLSPLLAGAGHEPGLRRGA